MNKLKILVIDRPIKSNEDIVKDVFRAYGNTYDLIIIPPREDDAECLIQAVSFKKSLELMFSEIFYKKITTEEGHDFYDFDLEEIELDTFYDMLARQFEIEIFNLSIVENK